MLSSPTQVESLPEDRRDEATNHELRSREDAEDLLDDLEQEARALTAPEPEPEPRPGGGDGGGGGNQAGGGGGGGNGSGGGSQAGP